MIGLSDPRATIVAIASSPTPSLRGIVRIAGEQAIEIVRQFTTWPESLSRNRPSRSEILLKLNAPLGDVDATLYVWPTNAAYAGCPSIELHTFGSLPILESIVQVAVAAGARPAGPGEFTMRAFLAGRLDLTQVEAVLGVIDATSQNQLDAALTQLAGNVSAPFRQARDLLLNLLADVEAGLDFVEEDIAFIDDATLRSGLVQALAIVESVSKKLTRQRSSESIHWVVLRGLPNAGKSSLLNAIANQNVSIVSSLAGTTRDVVWKELTLSGYRVRFADTAGIEACVDEVTTQSQFAAEQAQQVASIILQCAEMRAGTDACLEDTTDAVVTIRVATKADQYAPALRQPWIDDGWHLTSAVSGEGVGALMDLIAQQLAVSPDVNESGVPATAARCHDASELAMRSLTSAKDFLDRGVGHEFIASEIRQSLSAIGEITGEIYTDDLLDRVFSRFCIGK